MRFGLTSLWEGVLDFPDTPLCSPRLDIEPAFGVYIVNNGVRNYGPGTVNRFVIRLIPQPNPDSTLIWELIPWGTPIGMPFPYGLDVEPP